MLRSNEDINWEIDVLRPCCTHSPSVGARACDGLWKVSMSGKSKPNDQVEEERVGTVAKYWHLFLKAQGSIMSRPQLTTVTCGLYMVSTLRTQVLRPLVADSLTAFLCMLYLYPYIIC
ncbi:hypothetical protein SLEP1_g57130 [Rubroshorea leprosula]|uniref:Uncharacterized protein n=1 Tax=Rubroshorea leprosula TaxID=152421 RepID=A0AAV5MPT7_9ROSI|nr:hypothetical protein SLEP1_g57130 [Rubroshorea leprosula]